MIYLRFAFGAVWFLLVALCTRRVCRRSLCARPGGCGGGLLFLFASCLLLLRCFSGRLRRGGFGLLHLCRGLCPAAGSAATATATASASGTASSCAAPSSSPCLLGGRHRAGGGACSSLHRLAFNAELQRAALSGALGR